MPGREFKPRIRKSGFRDAKLIIIAAEGIQTEKKYFEDLAFDERYRNPKVHVEILERSTTASSPDHVIKELDEFRRNFKLKKNYDELWLVIDLDRWGIGTISDISTQCIQKNYLLAVSNPCFEIWLLLHLTSLDNYTPAEILELSENQKIINGKITNRTRLERELMKLCGSHNKSNLDTSYYIPNVEIAIEHAKVIDINLFHRWPNQIGTRVYLLTESIIRISRH